MRELRHHFGLLLSPVSFQIAAPPAPRPPAAELDRDWAHGRNALGIARLLVHEGRSSELVGTACRMALEAASRAALTRAGFPYDGDLERSLLRLSAPGDLLAGLDQAEPRARLAACERALAFLSNYLRSVSPERSWAF